MNDMMDMGDDQQSNPQTIPRLNGNMLMSGNFNGAQVSIVGKLINTDSNDSTVTHFEAADGKRFRVKIDTQQAFNGYRSKYIEIRGQVQPNGQIFQQSHQEFGEEFAMDTWNKFVVLTHSYPQIF